MTIYWRQQMRKEEGGEDNRQEEGEMGEDLRRAKNEDKNMYWVVKKGNVGYVQAEGERESDNVCKAFMSMFSGTYRLSSFLSSPFPFPFRRSSFSFLSHAVVWAPRCIKPLLISRASLRKHVHQEAAAPPPRRCTAARLCITRRQRRKRR